MNSKLRPRAGVAMCVYNGAKYLQEQLASIAAQTELPLRMVIVDDCSRDNSWALLESWAASAPFPVHLQRNESNVGVVGNFEMAAKLLLGDVDVVFFSDQDDRWYPSKLATIVDAFAADPSLGLVHSDADLIDGTGRSLGRRLFETLLVTDAERQFMAQGLAYRVYARRNLVTGAACAVRKDVLAQALPFPARWVHDESIAFTASLVSGVLLMDEPTMAYRLHGANAVGIPVPTRMWKLRQIVLAFVQAQRRRIRRLERLQEVQRQAVRLKTGGAARNWIDAATEFAHYRATLPRNPFARAAVIYQRWRSGGYRNEWAIGALSALSDLLLP